MIREALLDFFQEPRLILKNHSIVLLACSGGSDSVALVRAAYDLRLQLPFRFHVAHVQHGLRGKESKRDAAFVRALAKRLKLPFHELHAKINKKETGNLEEKARNQRYRALTALATKLKSPLVLSAHHNDDQVETVFLNLLRGAGADGLAGMERIRILKSPGIFLGRPFLILTHADILSFLKSVHEPYRTDRTNADHEFNRNWLRLKFFPQIEKKWPHFKTNILRTSKLFREEKDYWSHYLSDISKEILTKRRGGWLLDFKRLLIYPPSVQKRFFRHVAGRNLLTFDAVERLRRWMISPPSEGRIWQLKKGWIFERLSKSKGSPSSSLFWLHQSRLKSKKRVKKRGK
jgi:tRNA(Ile)-lysidine synthase